jgi:two-component system, sensor histidine kinase PdtaS
VVTHPARPHEVARTVAGPAPRPAPQSIDEERHELDHRLANSLQLAADFLIFEHLRVADPKARAALMETAERLSAVGQMHRFLAAQHQADGVDLDPFLTELGALITDSTGLACSVDAAPIVVEAEVAQQLAIAINELAMNAAKHAYPWGDRGPLRIACRRHGGMLVISVADEGEGLDEDFLPHRAGGLGMSILQAIVRQLRGTLSAVSDRGACFTITLPLPLGRSAARGPRSFAPGD